MYQGVLIIFIVTFVLLGKWQIDRSHEKKRIIDNFNEKLVRPTKQFNQINFDDNDIYKPYYISGRYLTQFSYLQEGKILNNRLGVDLYMPFETLSGKIILVNRGWLLTDYDRTKIPVFNTPEGVTRLHGFFIKESDYAYINETKTISGWPHHVVEIDIQIIGKQIKREIFPFIFVLKEDSDSVYQYHWRAINMSPQKHFGYAIQWYAMAIALIILTIKFTFQREG